jgi:orotidine-5'-phosphate decarboxylase
MEKRVLVALDVSNLQQAGNLIENLAPHVAGFKIGLELQTAVGGPQAVAFVHECGGEVFYDGKFYDIPNTVAAAVKGVVDQGVKFCNIHALSGAKAMAAAKEAAKGSKTQLLAVTILTSLDYPALVEMGIFPSLNYADSAEQKKVEQYRIEELAVRHLAWLAQENGMDGVIASAKELGAIRKYCQPELLTVIPGIRPEWAAANDQKRVMTPGEAIRAGADYLVIGRPITRPPAKIGYPVDAIWKINEEINEALVERSGG